MTVQPFAPDPIKDALQQILAESYELKPVALPWTRLAKASKLLRPGTLAVVGGAPGSGKSFFSLSLGLACKAAKVSWAYLPLESDRSFYVRRVAAMLDGKFDALLDIDDAADARDRACNAIHRVTHELDRIVPSISENPALPGPNGDTQVVTTDYVLEWLRQQFVKGRRVCIVDPLAMIDFSGSRDQWRSETAFVQDLVSLAYGSGGTIVLVAHTTKRVENRVIETGDLQGGAAIGRLASSVVLLQAHEPKESTVFRFGGTLQTVEHNRTVTVAKSRNSECGAPIAFDFGRAGPVYQELGVIAPKGRAKLEDAIGRGGR